MASVEMRQVAGEAERELVIRGDGPAGLERAHRLVWQLNIADELEHRLNEQLAEAEDGVLVSQMIDLTEDKS